MNEHVFCFVFDIVGSNEERTYHQYHGKSGYFHQAIGSNISIS